MDRPPNVTEKRWKTFLDSPVAAHPVRTVGEDEFRVPGSVSAAGLNLIFGNSNTPVDIEILEVTVQPAVSCVITVTIGGVPITAGWTLRPQQIWSSPGFILERGKQILINVSVANLVAFEVRWRLYYGRQV